MQVLVLGERHQSGVAGTQWCWQPNLVPQVPSLPQQSLKNAEEWVPRVLLEISVVLSVSTHQG